jgi:hypothetical protein
MIQPLSSADDGPQRASALSETRATDSRADASSDDDTGRSYDAFISYSHKGERDLARSLERTLRTFGRKWYQTHGIRTFRDETNLAAEPDLWPGIRRAVRHSRNLVLAGIAGCGAVRMGSARSGGCRTGKGHQFSLHCSIRRFAAMD